MPRLETLVRRSALLACAFLSACGRPSHRPARRVILVTCDTLRADRLGAYGYSRPTSPHVDAFARDATLFEHATTTVPLTGPAMSSLLAGRIPDEIGLARGNHTLMPPSVVTLPEILADAGVETAAVVSIVVLKRPPAEFGDAGVSQGFRHYDDEMHRIEPNRPFPQRGGEETTDAAIAWLSADPNRARQDFFLWVHYQDPHGPYTPPEPWASQFARPPDPDEPALPVGGETEGHGCIPGCQVVTSERRPGPYRDRYDGEVRTFDEAFGRLVAWIQAHGMYEGSLIVFSADHGEALGEHDDWFCHGSSLYEEQIGVPMIIRFPAGSGRGPEEGSRGGPRGVRRSERVSHLDLWPTVLEAFDLPPRPNRGTSLFASSLPRDRVLFHSLGKVGEPGRWAAVTSDHHRLVLAPGRGPCLYDLVADPGETRDLAAVEPERVRDLLARGRDFFEGKGTPLSEIVDRQAEGALRALGYAGDAQDR